MNVGPAGTGAGRDVQLRGVMASPLSAPCGAPVTLTPAVAAPVDGLTVKTLSWPAAELRIPLNGAIAEVRNLSGAQVEWKHAAGVLTLTVPAESRGSPVTILEVRRGAAASRRIAGAGSPP